MGGAYFMTSERLGFRLWSSDDLPLASSLWGDPKVAALIGGPFDERQIQARLDREIACMAAHQVQYWPIFLLAGGEHVGCAGLRPYKTEDCIFEIGFHLRPQYWRQGLAEEAARRIIAFAFDNRLAAALFAGHHPDNGASRRILVKLGFTYTRDELYEPTGELHPSYLLSPRYPQH